MIKFNLNEYDVWVFSDPHYDHENICRGTTKWKFDSEEAKIAATRDFKALDEMNQALVDGINNVVKPNDILICLGDWSFNGIQNIYNFRKRIICNNVHLCYGNHDHHIKNNTAFPVKFKDLMKGYEQEILIKPQPLFTSTQDTLEFIVSSSSHKYGGKYKFFCSHYSHRIWNKRHHGVMHLFGHSHGGLDKITFDKSMDVGMDSAFKRFGEYRPFNIKEVIDILSKRESEPIDHHNKKTN